MKALVVYESIFGNTRHIAEAVADGLRQSIDTELIRAHDAGEIDFDDVRLMVVGAPTHAWSLSREHTRESAFLDPRAPRSPPRIGVDRYRCPRMAAWPTTVGRLPRRWLRHQVRQAEIAHRVSRTVDPAWPVRCRVLAVR